MNWNDTENTINPLYMARAFAAYVDCALWLLDEDTVEEFTNTHTTNRPATIRSHWLQ